VTYIISKIYSLQATFIRNAILRGIKFENSPFASEWVDRHVSPNVVFEHPTINGLATLLYSYLDRQQNMVADKVSPTAHTQEMKAMVAKYTADIASRKNLTSRTVIKPAVILLTGTTGVLGSYLTEFLVNSPDVARVWALNRETSGTNLVDRQKEALRDRGISESIIQSEKLRLVEGDLVQPQFGLPDTVWKEVNITRRLASSELIINIATAAIVGDSDNP
jgi:hypothetical protein